MNILKNSPYNLGHQEISFLKKYIDEMTIDQKIGQLFFVIGQDKPYVDLEVFIQKYQPGGVMYRSDTGRKINQQIQSMQNISVIPMFTAANLEAGGNGIITEGTYVAQPMGIAATADTDNAFLLGKIAGKEAASVGINMSFSPIVDIDLNFKNPITNVRTFGKDKKMVLEFAKSEIKGFQEEQIIPVIKHFPGDGVDERDQHLLTAVNHLDIETWEEEYGYVYRSLINQGIPVIMIGHLALPAYAKYLAMIDKEETINLPASLSNELINILLREKLNFQGLTITDATPMLGYNTVMPRREALPLSIAAGVDMILFNKNIDEDYQSLKNGLNNGIISEEVINLAVMRILGTKVAQGVWNIDTEKSSLTISNQALDIDFAEHKKIARNIASKAITLVKDDGHILPLSVLNYPKIRLYVLGDNDEGGFKQGGNVGNKFEELLIKEGFDVVNYNKVPLNLHEIFEEGIEDLKRKFDLALYVANVETASNQTTARINWIQLMAANAPWFVKDIPTVLVSTANPYHLFDVPMISTVINGYSSNEESVVAIIRKLLGKEKFEGINPINPYVG